MGKMPVVWSMGSSLPAIILSPPEIVTLNEASGQLTLPCTVILVSEFQVLEVVLIHGPTTWAPWLDGKVVWHESTLPTLAVVEILPSPSGIAAGLTGSIARGTLIPVAVDDIDVVVV
jgi:hypothetical protein